MGKKTEPDGETLVGIDTGGTFTDVIARESGRLIIHKLLSTPTDPSEAIGDGYGRAVDVIDQTSTGQSASPGVVHGTTVATNALLERDTARCAFLVTAGFEDLLELRRQSRPELYSVDIERSNPLIERYDVLGVHERIGPDGQVIDPLNAGEVTRILEHLRKQTDSRGIESVAICLLHSYANNAHESRLADAIRAADDLSLHVSTSDEVVGEFREYERASTTTVNAAVAPVMDSYLGRLRDRLPTDDIDVLQSSGGRVDVEQARRFPVDTVLSGPAGGVVGAITVARGLGRERILSLDMGGTSTDVSLCNGEVALTGSTEVDGLPIQSPVIDIHTVGAGGGSIARRDVGGGLRVGPESAGAEPGPACYGRGGTRPTVTDAHVVLGRIQPGRFLGGRMSLDLEAAHRAIEPLAGELEMSVEETALGILRVAEASMTRALKVMSVGRGEDPRELTLVAFGGAGALHACRLAEQLDMKGVIIPRNPGLLSAYGMLHADYQRMNRRSVLEPLAEVLSAPADLKAMVAEMIESATETAPYSPSQFEFQLDAALRYRGQSFEIDVTVDWAEVVGSDESTSESPVFEDPTERFEAEHEKLYGYRADRAVELVGVRLRAVVPGAEPKDYTQVGVEGSGGDTDGLDRAEVRFREGAEPTDVRDRRDLSDGQPLHGPTIVTEYSATTVIPPGWRGRVVQGALVLESGS